MTCARVSVLKSAAIVTAWAWALLAAALVLSSPALSNPALGEALDDGASILMYHRFGEQEHPSTNTTLEQLDAHIEEITDGDYTPISLDDIVKRLESGDGFPSKSVAITIDDAYRSVYTQAWPRFQKAGIAFTLFVATDPVDQGYSGYMTWDMIREMAADPLVTIGSQTANHLHMVNASDAENIADLEQSNRRFHEELGAVPTLIAYPYGEFSNRVINLVKQNGFIAGFGQHSGALGHKTDRFALPRFAMNETYGDLGRLRTAAGALPIPVDDMIPTDTVVTSTANPPYVGFTLPVDRPDIMEHAEQLACFSNHEGKLKLERLGPRVEVRMTQKLPQGRTRLNCTLPAENGRWRWLGRLFFVK